MKAPLQKGDVIGNLTIKEDDKVTRTIPITVKEDIKKANILELYWRYLTDILMGDMKL